MLFPIRCFTCGKLIAHLWEPYQFTLQEEFNHLLNTYSEMVSEEKKRTIEAETLDKLGIKRYCCRRMFLSHVDMCAKI